MKCEECFFALLSINDDDAKLHCGNCASMYWMQDMRRDEGCDAGQPKEKS